MLQYYLFGNNFDKVEQNEIKRTLKPFLFHIALIERAKQIFNIVNLCGAEMFVNNNNNNNNDNDNNNSMIQYSCCGKVIIMNLDTNSEI